MGKNRDSRSIGRNIFAEKNDEKLQVDESITAEFLNTNKKAEESEKDEELLIVEESSPGKSIRVGKSADSQSIVALDISDDCVVLMETIYQDGSYMLKNLEIEEIEKTQISEDNMFRGQTDNDLLIKKVEAVDRVFAKAGLIKKNTEVVCALKGNNIIVKQVEVRDKEVEEIEAELPNVLPTPFNDPFSRYEYVLLRSKMKNHTVLASVVESKIFFDMQSFLAAAQLECSILDLDVMSVVNLYLASVKPKESEIACILDVGETDSHIVICSTGNEEIYIRNLDFNFNSLIKVIAKNRDITPLEAEEMVRSRNFYDYMTKAYEGETSENLNKLYSVKDYIKRQLMTELQKTFSYYTKKNDFAFPKKIFVTGIGTEIGKFTNFIVKTMDISCEALDVCSPFEGNASLMKRMNEERSQVYRAAGLSLRYN